MTIKKPGVKRTHAVPTKGKGSKKPVFGTTVKPKLKKMKGM